MSGRNRTFVLQAVGVAVLVAIIFFAFLRPGDVEDIAGIDAPGDGGPTLTFPGNQDKHGNNDGKQPERNSGDAGSAGSPRGGDAAEFAPVRPGAGNGAGLPPTGGGPAADQYTDTVSALRARVRGLPDQNAR